MSIDLIAEIRQRLVDTVKRGEVDDYFPVYSAGGAIRWRGVLCKECKMEYHKGHDPDCRVGHREGVGRLD